MKKLNSILLLSLLSTFSYGQELFDLTLDAETDILPSQVVMPRSPLDMQVLFVGGVDMVQTTATYGNAAGQTVAKEWHDFIGVTADNVNSDEFWVSVNHERIQMDPMIGDGGGMTVFKLKEQGDSLAVVAQTLTDGRSGDFFNVDFVNFVGETGMNCGGIQSDDGRIWTAEEWFRTSNGSIAAGVNDTLPFTISTDIVGDFDGSQVAAYENFNYMVEIDPREAHAIRKQYNWGRQGFEGGAVAADGKTVYLGVDGTPCFFLKFVADVAGDFTSGQLYGYKHDSPSKWVMVDNSKLANVLNLNDVLVDSAATMYNRIEWVTMDTSTGIVYMTETGRDNPGSRWADESAEGGVHAPHHIARAAAQGTAPDSSDYADYYGRILMYDPATDEISVLMEAGAGSTMYDNEESAGLKHYPSKHLSNPDGLSTMYTDGGAYLIVQEDLNGYTMNRMPYGITQRTCEMFLLDLGIQNPEIDDLIRITAVPHGAEITGARMTPSGNFMLVNSQHPASSEMVNDYPFNHSLTLAISGFDGLVTASHPEVGTTTESGIILYPNPATREIHLSEVTDVAIYHASGIRVLTATDTDVVDVAGLAPGHYTVVTSAGDSVSFIVQ